MNRRTRPSLATKSFEVFVDHVTGSLLRTAYLITWNLPEAEDAVQEALSRAAARWTRVEKMEHPQAYVRRIVVNCATAEAKKRVRRLDEPRAGIAAKFDHLSDDRFEQQLAQIDTRSEILWLLAQLSRQQRAVLVLRYFEDLSESEIAANLCIPIGTVKSTASRALDQLRRSISDAPSEPAEPLHCNLPITKGTLT
jgi:RNA polymerase sigma-70 factor (sigma-E family)